MKKNIAVLSGDGIGPEIMQETLKVLDSIAKKYNHQFIYQRAEIGGAAYEKYQEHCPKKTIEICNNSDAILFGSVGGPVDAQLENKWKNCEANSLLAIRKTFGFNINIRPVKMYPELSDHCPLKQRVIKDDTDIVIFRELIGDIYFGEHKLDKNDRVGRFASDTANYNEAQIASIMHAAFKAARNRKKKVTSVDKANVLATSKLWREIATEVHQEYPDIELQHLYVDNCAMQMIINPRQFDVIVTANLFGDILSDLASVLPGSLGLIPSASLNENNFGMFEPSGGSAPDIANQGIANPIAQILSAAMMLEYSFNLNQEADDIRNAVNQTIKEGHRTIDLAQENEKVLSTSEITNVILQNI